MLKKKSMPPNAKCVFKGKIFDVWQWEQKMFDGSVEIFERLKRSDGAQVIATVGDKVILQTEEQPDKGQSFPSIPGGRIDEGEQPLDAAKRELLEESGYASGDWIYWNEIEPASKIDWTVFTFIARNCVLEKEPKLDAGEKIKTRLVSFGEFVKIATEDPLFYSPEIVPELLRMRLEPEKLEHFRKLLFGK